MSKVGIDIVEIKRMKLDTEFVVRILSVEELKMFNSFPSKKRQKEFLAGRWAVKEALIKSTEQKIIPHMINIGYVDNGAPYITNKGFDKYSISISHENKYAIAICINESGE